MNEQAGTEFPRIDASSILLLSFTKFKRRTLRTVRSDRLLLIEQWQFTTNGTFADDQSLSRRDATERNGTFQASSQQSYSTRGSLQTRFAESQAATGRLLPLKVLDDLRDGLVGRTDAA